MTNIMGSVHYKMKWAERKKIVDHYITKMDSAEKMDPNFLYENGPKTPENVLKPTKKLGQMGPPS
jgi:hypothetical protein